MKPVFRYVLVLLGGLLGACMNREVVVPDALSAGESKLVVACFISPQDSLLTAVVSRSRPLLDPNPEASTGIATATVTLSDGQRSGTLPYDGRVGFYQTSARALPIVAGRTYTLTVSAPDGRQVRATCNVPHAVALRHVALDSAFVTENDTVRKRFSVRYAWAATSGRYYQTQGEVGLTGAGGPITQRIVFKDTQNDRGLIMSDTADEPLTSAPGLLGDVLASATFQTRFSGATLSAHLLHVDAIYYHYHNALARQRQTDGNPFAEPVPIPTNIDGGLGCFAAFNRSTVLMRF